MVTRRMRIRMRCAASNHLKGWFCIDIQARRLTRINGMLHRRMQTDGHRHLPQCSALMTTHVLGLAEVVLARKAASVV